MVPTSGEATLAGGSAPAPPQSHSQPESESYRAEGSNEIKEKITVWLIAGEQETF